MGFYKVGMRIQPHPDVPGVYGTVVEADDERFVIEWEDGEFDPVDQTDAEEPDFRVESSS